MLARFPEAIPVVQVLDVMLEKINIQVLVASKNPTFPLIISNHSKRIMRFSMCFFMILPRKIIDRTGWPHRLHQGIPRELRKELLKATGRRMALQLWELLLSGSGWRRTGKLTHLERTGNDWGYNGTFFFKKKNLYIYIYMNNTNISVYIWTKRKRERVCIYNGILLV